MRTSKCIFWWCFLPRDRLEHKPFQIATLYSAFSTTQQMLVTKILVEIQHSHEVVPNILDRAFVSENHGMAWVGKVLSCSCCGLVVTLQITLPKLFRETNLPQTKWIILSGYNASQNVFDFLFPP